MSRLASWLRQPGWVQAGLCFSTGRGGDPFGIGARRQPGGGGVPEGGRRSTGGGAGGGAARLGRPGPLPRRLPAAHPRGMGAGRCPAAPPPGARGLMRFRIWNAMPDSSDEACCFAGWHDCTTSKQQAPSDPSGHRSSWHRAVHGHARMHCADVPRLWQSPPCVRGEQALEQAFTTMVALLAAVWAAERAAPAAPATAGLALCALAHLHFARCQHPGYSELVQVRTTASACSVRPPAAFLPAHENSRPPASHGQVRGPEPTGSSGLQASAVAERARLACAKMPAAASSYCP